MSIVLNCIKLCSHLVLHFSVSIWFACPHLGSTNFAVKWMRFCRRWTMIKYIKFNQVAFHCSGRENSTKDRINTAFCFICLFVYPGFFFLVRNGRFCQWNVAMQLSIPIFIVFFFFRQKSVIVIARLFTHSRHTTLTWDRAWDI